MPLEDVWLALAVAPDLPWDVFFFSMISLPQNLGQTKIMHLVTFNGGWSLQGIGDSFDNVRKKLSWPHLYNFV